MSYSFSDGILGIEAIHRWVDPAGSAPYDVELNRQDAWPRVLLDRITGLHAAPEGDDDRVAATGRIGEVAYLSRPRGKTVTYEGRVLGRTLTEMRRHQAVLRGIFTGRRHDRRMYLHPHEVIGGDEVFFNARPLSFDCDDEQVDSPWASPTPYQRSFVLSLRLGDPRFYLADQVSLDGESTDILAVTNAGDAPTDPSFFVTGPVNGDLTFNRIYDFDDPDADPRSLVFTDVQLDAGEQLKLSFADRTFQRVSDGEDYMGALDLRVSDWWNENVNGLEPGPSQVMVTIDGGSAASGWEVRFYSARW